LILIFDLPLLVVELLSLTKEEREVNINYALSWERMIKKSEF